MNIYNHLIAFHHNLIYLHSKSQHLKNKNGSGFTNKFYWEFDRNNKPIWPYYSSDDLPNYYQNGIVHPFRFRR